MIWGQSNVECLSIPPWYMRVWRRITSWWRRELENRRNQSTRGGRLLFAMKKSGEPKP